MAEGDVSTPNPQKAGRLIHPEVEGGHDTGLTAVDLMHQDTERAPEARG